jgi:hypothetical protein
MPKVSKKPKSELEKEYVEKVRHAVISAMKWTKKVAKLARSKKYQLTAAQKTKIAEQYDAMIRAVDLAFNAPPEEKVEEDSFKL